MRRRTFISLLGGAAVWPLGHAHAQQAMPVIGYLSTNSLDPAVETSVRAFRQGLSELGYFEGQNLAIEFRSAEGQYDRIPALASDLVRKQVAVIVAASSPGALAAKGATTTIPIVFSMAVDPVQIGLVASLNRPGGNVTGVTNLGGEVGPKRLELLHEVIPTATIALLANPTNRTAESMIREMQMAARTLGIQLHVQYASTERDFEAVFTSLSRLRAGGLVIGADPFYSNHSDQLATLALRHALPAIYQYGAFTSAGGLMSYGGSVTDGYRLVGVYTGRILKGEKPADLPVQQATKVELIINMKTAKALGLTVPLTLLGRADEVIE
jgi:putative ABC transport system substrate-binding protein